VRLLALEKTHAGVDRDGRDLRAHCQPAPENLLRGATLWFEVEDFLRCLDDFPHVTGIRRVCLEIFSAVEEQYGVTGRVEFSLFDPTYLAAREARPQAEYRPASWADCAHALIALLDRTAASTEVVSASAAPVVRHDSSGTEALRA
jgi:hypothetical protein